MKHTLTAVVLVGIGLTPSLSSAAQTYCPEGHSYIQVGMTENQVLAACGQPTSRSKSNQAPTQRVPMKQLIYSSTIPSQPYPGITSDVLNPWSMPSGIHNTYNIQFNIVNNKVKSVQMNGSGTNAMSGCDSGTVQVGDTEDQVYAACGTPTQTNLSYINQPIAGNTKTEIWIYQLDQYQPAIRLTFVNGSLESID